MVESIVITNYNLGINNKTKKKTEQLNRQVKPFKFFFNQYFTNFSSGNMANHFVIIEILK
jgi:hypothetical protein